MSKVVVGLLKCSHSNRNSLMYTQVDQVELKLLTQLSQ